MAVGLLRRALNRHGPLKLCRVMRTDGRACWRAAEWAAGTCYDTGSVEGQRRAAPERLAEEPKMAASEPTADALDAVPVRELTAAESRAWFDAQAQALLGIGGAEFLRRLDAGAYDDIADTPGHLGIVELAMMRGFFEC